MKNSGVIVGLVLAVVGLMYWGRNQVKSMIINTDTALQNSNVIALLAVLREIEGMNSYWTLYHCPHDDPLYDPSLPLTFTDPSTHPNIRIPFTNPATGRGDFSTAAGGYQITHPTWLGLSVLPGAPIDFGPNAQDWYAVQLLKMNGALAPLMAGNFQQAMQLASGTWASLPYTNSQQHHLTLASVQGLYQQNGGSIA